VKTYTVILTLDSEDGGYVVTVPALPGCVTLGDTVEEALENAEDVIRVFLKSMEKHGEPIPVETTPPLVQTVRV
jgi:predicted RNase H-like HicB family nuclease